MQKFSNGLIFLQHDIFLAFLTIILHICCFLNLFPFRGQLPPDPRLVRLWIDFQ